MRPGQFMIMLAGVQDRIKRDRHKLVQLLHVLRMPAAQAVAASRDNGKADIRDVIWIEEIDGDYKDYIREKEIQKQQKQKRDDEIYMKYKALEGVNARRSNH